MYWSVASTHNQRQSTPNHCLVRRHRPRPTAWLMSVFGLAFAGCATGFDTPPSEVLAAVITIDAGMPAFTGEACNALGDRTACPCPDGTTQGVKVCSAQADSPTGAAYSTCLACPGTPINSTPPAGGSPATPTAGTAALAAGTRAVGTAGTSSGNLGGGASVLPAAGSGGNAGIGSSSAGALALDAGVATAGSQAAGSGARAGAGGSAGTPVAGSGGAASSCNCQRLCLIGSNPCCRFDGFCGCTLLFSNVCF